jgi:abelson tyrosine-protein kinase 1
MEDYDRYDSPLPVDERIAELRNERRYRYLLTHDYNASRESVHQCNDVSLITLLVVILPLWDPSPVDLGAVGYLSKPRGRFITLFNAFSPQKSNDDMVRSLPPIYRYGQVKEGSQRLDKRSRLQQGLDAVTGPFAGLLTFRSRGVS